MKLVRESVYNFHKTGDVKSSLGIGRFKVKNLIAFNLAVDPNKKLDLSHDDTEYFHSICEENFVDYTVVNVYRRPPVPNGDLEVELELIGPRDGLIQVLTLFDPDGRDFDQLKEELDSVGWMGEQDKLEKVLWKDIF